MFPKKSLLLFAAGWMLLALVALPAHASAAASQLNPSTVIIDTFPIFENHLAVRQAHVAWLAAKEDVGMQTAIAYVQSVNGSTLKLSIINENFRKSQMIVAKAESHDALDAIMQDFRVSTQSFRDETAVQLKATDGKPGELREFMQSALAASELVKLSEDQYWDTRGMTELADFDQRAGVAGELLTAFRSNGYEITAAKEKLTEITTMRNELATAIRARDNPGIEQAHKKIHAASIGFAQAVREIRINESPDTNLRQNIEQGRAMMTRAGMVNADLQMRGLNNGSAGTYVGTGITQLAVASAQLDKGNTGGAKATLLQFRATIQSLRDSYRLVLIKEDLPQATAQGVLSVAQSLDITAARMLAL
jgi:predicted DNA-binding protein (UPF0278 family)